MIQIEKCKKILNEGEKRYKDEDIRKIREFLYIMGIIENNELKTNKI